MSKYTLTNVNTNIKTAVTPKVAALVLFTFQDAFNPRQTTVHQIILGDTLEAVSAEAERQAGELNARPAAVKSYEYSWTPFCGDLRTL